jgi:hypothetical protein
VFSTGAGPPSGGGGKGDADDVASAGVAKAQVAKTPTFRVTTRSRLSGVAIRGRGGAPHVRVTGPGGLSLAVDQTNTTARSGDTILILNPGDKTTYLSFQHARIGTYRITTLPGSPPLRWARFSAKLAAPRVGASVNAAGCAERLTWHVKPLPGQSVQFIERIKGAPDRLLKNTAKASGSLTFTPQTSTVASRTVLAQVIQQGTPRTTITVARFHAITGNPPAKVRGLKGKRTGRKVALRWAPVCGAVGYLISTAVGKNTAQVTSAKTHLTVNAGKAARISVAAGGFAGALGRAATIKVR